jgi:branched-chain amino acid transport system substrate-binding protein
MHTLKFRGLTRPVQMRADGQGLEDQLLGVTKKVPEYPFPVLDQMMIVPASTVTTPIGEKSPEWVKKLTPDFLKTENLKSFAYSK